MQLPFVRISCVAIVIVDCRMHLLSKETNSLSPHEGGGPVHETMRSCGDGLGIQLDGLGI